MRYRSALFGALSLLASAIPEVGGAQDVRNEAAPAEVATETATEVEAPPAEALEAELAQADGMAALLGEDELDALVGPVALYPDSLLAQVFVAATYPFELLKADRWLTENAALSDKERADAAQAQDWDPSVQVLAAAFPDVISRLTEDIDATESLGDAVLGQTDDVLASVQRLRAQAAAAGNLEGNEAQVVETEGDQITIEPADPEVVYVPQYEPATAFAPYPAGQPPVVYDNNAGDLLTTGAIASAARC